MTELGLSCGRSKKVALRVLPVCIGVYVKTCLSAYLCICLRSKNYK